MSSQKSMPLTKEEVMQLVQLVETNPVVFSKATNASNNQLKEVAWRTITEHFNALIARSPRKPEQLRLVGKFKKNCPKRSTKINNLKTGGGKPDYIPPDEALDKVAAILGPTCNGYTVQFGGDNVVKVAEQEMEMVEELAVMDECDLEFIPQTVVPPALSPHTPKSKFFFSSVSSKGKQKRQADADEVKISIKERNQAIAEYYRSKLKCEEEIHILKKRKLELENLEREKKLSNDSCI